MEFIDITNFSGTTILSYNDLNFHSFDLSNDFGFSDISPDGLVSLRKYLEDSANLERALEYLVSKIGFDPTDQNKFK